MMTRISFRIAALAAIASITAFAADDADEAAGESLYVAHGCYTCHGYNGTGRRPLAGIDSGIIQNDVVFLAYLRARADVKPMLPYQGMPHYAEATLSDAEALAIFAYIQSFDDQPPSVDEAPALRAIRDAAEADNEE